MGQSFPFTEIVLDGDELTFWWVADVHVDCRLLRDEDGSFEGVCTDGSGADGEGRLTMVPPPGEDRS